MPVTHATGIAMSGMQAAAQRLNVTANNVANANTEGYKSEEIVSEDLSNGGVTTEIVRIDEEPPVVLRDDQLIGASNTDLLRETINRVEAINAYKANATVFRTADEVSDTLLDIV